MRELKFRAWDSERKTYDHEEILLAPNGDLLASRWQELCEPESEYIIEEYTGLKDKNGKEIYEGDIVKYGGGNAYEVCFFNGCFGIKNRNLSVLYNSYTFNDNDLYGSNGKLRLEVIGNIHENPELLEAKNVD